MDTCIQIGRIIEIVKDERCFLYKRTTIKARLCGTVSVGDPDVRRALIARYGGTKKGEPLGEIVSHMWSALGVATYHADVMKYGYDDSVQAQGMDGN